MKKIILVLGCLFGLVAGAFATDYFSVDVFDNGVLFDYASFEDTKSYRNELIENIQLISGVDYDCAKEIVEVSNKIEWTENPLLKDKVKKEMKRNGSEYCLTNMFGAIIINRKYGDKYYIKAIYY